MMESTKPKNVGVRHFFKSVFVVIYMTIIFYCVPMFITLDFHWPLNVSNSIRGVVIILYIIITWMSMPDKDETYKSINQRR